MDADERGLTADEVYDATISSYIDDGRIGNITLQGCPECDAPSGIKR